MHYGIAVARCTPTRLRRASQASTNERRTARLARARLSLAPQDDCTSDFTVPLNSTFRLPTERAEAPARSDQPIPVRFLHGTPTTVFVSRRQVLRLGMSLDSPVPRCSARLPPSPILTTKQAARRRHSSGD